LGIIVYIAAGLFWLLGWALDINGNYTYHGLNMFFFDLSGIMVAFGFIYAILVKGTKAFAREPLLEATTDEDVVKDKGEEPIAAPTPYTMLPAEP